MLVNVTLTNTLPEITERLIIVETACNIHTSLQIRPLQADLLFPHPLLPPLIHYFIICGTRQQKVCNGACEHLAMRSSFRNQKRVLCWQSERNRILLLIFFYSLHKPRLYQTFHTRFSHWKHTCQCGFRVMNIE